MRPRHRPILSILALMTLLALLASSGCRRDSNRVTHISLDFPHGELRLVLHRDDGARLTYGALPAFQAVKDGTFDIDRLYEQLQTRINPVVPSEEMPGGGPAGMVSLNFADGSSSDHLIYDAAFAQELFTAACENLVLDGDFVQEVVVGACAERLTPTP
jgi:hypothetical protein